MSKCANHQYLRQCYIRRASQLSDTKTLHCNEACAYANGPPVFAGVLYALIMTLTTNNNIPFGGGDVGGWMSGV